MIGWLLAKLRGTQGKEVPINLSGLVLLTGNPGAGKTLRMIEYMEAAVSSGRPCFASNVDGLAMPGVEVWDDPHDWRALPPGAVLFVDEAQRYFRTRSGMKAVPESITAMETIRHDGVCIVMTTQQPTYLDKHLRGLVGRHEHLVEMVAGKVSNVYAWRSVRDDISPTAIREADFTAWAHPTRLHGAYKSAEIHTKRVLWPMRMKLLAAATVVMVGIIVYEFGMKESAITGERPKAAPAASGAAVERSGLLSARERGTPRTTLEFLEAMQPRIPGAPWSAPLYDDTLQVAEPPRIACIIGIKCRCITEQGTRYHVKETVCRAIVLNGGIFNPYERRRDEVEAAAVDNPVPIGDDPALIGAGGDAQVASYGDFRP